MNKKNIISALGATLLATPLLAGCNASNKTTTDFDKMRDAYKEYIMTSNKDTIEENKNKTAKQLIEEYKLVEKRIGDYKTYCIDGLDYNFDTDRNEYLPGEHVKIALKIAYIGEARKSRAIKDIAVKMTYYWVFNNYRSTNWWHNHLGAGGNYLSSLGLFVYDDLTDQGKAAMVGKIANASLYYHPSLTTHTGANLFDYADITLKNSIITRNEDEFETAVSRVEEEITDKNLEGFQTDGSFFQHGQQVQIASYGKGVKRLGNVLRTVSKSSRKFDADKLNIVDKYLRRGLRSMTHKGYLNYSAMSRELVRKNVIDAELGNNKFSEFSTYLELPDYPKKEELKRYLDSIANKQASLDEGEIVYFDKAKMLVGNIGGVYMSFKGVAPQLTNTECVNDENELGLNLSYGTNTCVMDEGDDYFNIAPIWDYAYIPGTTSINIKNSSSDTESVPNYLPAEIDKTIVGEVKPDGSRTPNLRDAYVDQLYERQLPVATDDNGYVYSDGYDETNKIAVSMQRSCHHDENEFTVTSVLCEDGMVLMGADLKYTGSITFGSDKVLGEESARLLHTTLDQTTKKGELSNDNKSYTRGNVLYTSLCDHDIKEVKREVKNNPDGSYDTYNWQRNSPQTVWSRKDPDHPSEEEIKDFVREGDTYTVYMDLEAGKPISGEATAGKYAYSIQPKSKQEKKFEVKYNFDTNTNGKKVQAVKLPTANKLLVVFYETVTEALTIDGIGNITGTKGEFKLYDYQG